MKRITQIIKRLIYNGFFTLKALVLLIILFAMNFSERNFFESPKRVQAQEVENLTVQVTYPTDNTRIRGNIEVFFEAKGPEEIDYVELWHIVNASESEFIQRKHFRGRKEIESSFLLKTNFFSEGINSFSIKVFDDIGGIEDTEITYYINNDITFSDKKVQLQPQDNSFLSLGFEKSHSEFSNFQLQGSLGQNIIGRSLGQNENNEEDEVRSGLFYAFPFNGNFASGWQYEGEGASSCDPFWQAQWYKVTSCPDFNGDGFPDCGNDLTAWWYGVAARGDYHNCDRNWGSIYKKFDISSFDNPLLSFTFYLDKENSFQKDIALVQAAADVNGNSGEWIDLYNGREHGWGWREKSINLTNCFEDEVWIKFNFDTQDQYRNNYRGWYLDEIEINNNGFATDHCFYDVSEGYLPSVTGTTTATLTTTPTLTMTPTRMPVEYTLLTDDFSSCGEPILDQIYNNKGNWGAGNPPNSILGQSFQSSRNGYVFYFDLCIGPLPSSMYLRKGEGLHGDIIAVSNRVEDTGVDCGSFFSKKHTFKRAFFNKNEGLVSLGEKYTITTSSTNYLQNQWSWNNPDYSMGRCFGGWDCLNRDFHFREYIIERDNWSKRGRDSYSDPSLWHCTNEKNNSADYAMHFGFSESFDFPGSCQEGELGVYITQPGYGQGIDLGIGNQISFSAVGCPSESNTSLNYYWDFENDGVVDYWEENSEGESSYNMSFLYPGLYVAEVIVEDENGNRARDSVMFFLYEGEFIYSMEPSGVFSDYYFKNIERNYTGSLTTLDWLDLTGFSNAEVFLDFWHWLEFEKLEYYDRVMVLATEDGANWEVVWNADWERNEREKENMGEWRHEENIDLSKYVGKKLKLSFVADTVDEFLNVQEYEGWYVDDIKVNLYSYDPFTATPTNTATFTNTYTATNTATSTLTFTSTATFTETATPYDFVLLEVTPTLGQNCEVIDMTIVGENFREENNYQVWMAYNLVRLNASTYPVQPVSDEIIEVNFDLNDQIPTGVYYDVYVREIESDITHVLWDAFRLIECYTPTFTSTETATATSTLTSSLTVTETETATSIGTETATATSTLTSTGTETATSTSTGTETATATSTLTSTGTETATSTFTLTSTGTETATSTFTLTSTGTETATSTFTSTSSSTATITSTLTFTSTATVTETPTTSSTTTASFTETASSTITATATSITAACADIYEDQWGEEDDSIDEAWAKHNVVDFDRSQIIYPQEHEGEIDHTFHEWGDEDWLYFWVKQNDLGRNHIIETYNLGVCSYPPVNSGAIVDTVLELYKTNSTAPIPLGILLAQNDDDFSRSGTLASRVDFVPLTAGWYVIKVISFSPELTGCDYCYSIRERIE